VHLKKGSFFAVLPDNDPPRANQSIEWYSGNIYGMEYSSPQSVALPHKALAHLPTTYQILISGDYEVPEITVRLSV
jgi:hypothetical protein